MQASEDNKKGLFSQGVDLKIVTPLNCGRKWHHQRKFDLSSEDNGQKRADGLARKVFSRPDMKIIHLPSISDDDSDDKAIQSEIGCQVSLLHFDHDDYLRPPFISPFFITPQLKCTIQSAVINHTISI